MKIILIDDSRSDRDALRLMLNAIPGTEVIGEAGDFHAGEVLLRSSEPDLLFLDIQIGRQNGFSLIPSVPPGTCVILTSVHHQYGPQAFDAGICDYLLKPVREERLFLALQKAAVSCCGRPPEELNRISVHRSGSDHKFIPLDAISAVIADGNYSHVLSGPHVHADRRRLRDWQMILAPLGFERLDRSHLLRTDRIDSLRPYGSGCLLKMQYCQSDLELGPTALERLRELGYQ